LSTIDSSNCLSFITYLKMSLNRYYIRDCFYRFIANNCPASMINWYWPLLLQRSILWFIIVWS